MSTKEKDQTNNCCNNECCDRSQIEAFFRHIADFFEKRSK